jgi:hypothetical protein
LMRFVLEDKKGRREVSLEVRGALLCGYTGRDQESVRRHIEELQRQGVAPPPSVPAFYPKPGWALTQAGVIEVVGKETSGEVEFFLLRQGEALYVGLGSDHTDRALERLDVLKSKQVCPSVLSEVIWDYEEVRGHWDELQIRSWIVKGGEKRLYQASTVESILQPEALLSALAEKARGGADGIALFSGTTPLLGGETIFADRFEGEIFDPVTRRRISVDYRVEPIEWYRE